MCHSIRVCVTLSGLLGVYSYDLLSRPTNLAFGNGTNTGLAYDTDSQDWSYTQNLAATAQDLTVSFTRNPAAQTLSRLLTNDLYSYLPPALSQSYTANGLNQYTAVGGTTFTHDPRGNLTNDGARTLSYDYENRLTNVDAATDFALAYDPLGRLRTTNDDTTTTTFLYSGDQMVSEYEGATLVDRYAFGAGIDRPITWYEGSSLTTRNWLHADELGSVIATSNNSGAATIYSYGPYGEPNAWSGLRFRYTGQIMLFEAQLYHYKARAYWAQGGRFLQTDPVGYEDDLNLYAYVRNDPVNQTDPTGQCPWCVVGAVIGGAVQAYDEHRRGTLNTPEGALRVAVAADAGAQRAGEKRRSGQRQGAAEFFAE